MSLHPLTIAQVNASDGRGGAERVARQLHTDFRALGHHAFLLVGRGEGRGPHVHPFPSDWRTAVAHAAAGPLRVLDRHRGLETYRYPATRRMLDVLPSPPDVVHLHNLHGGYFDLRLLPALGRRYPLFLTLHDAWLITGHCAHSLGCDRWRSGCGSCPDLTIYPEIRKDATAQNWRRKSDIFAASRLHVATPSRWLAERVRASMLSPAVQDLRVIPNGVDLSVFREGDRDLARSELGLPADEQILLTVGSGVGVYPFKDLATTRRAAAVAAELLGRALTLVILGGQDSEEKEGRLRIRSLPFQEDPRGVARCYHAADLYLHAAHADTFPNTVVEAMACGRPVVATAVGGIPEQVRSLRAGEGPGAWPAVSADDATGVLVPRADPEAMGRAAAELLQAPPLMAALGENASRTARSSFDSRRQSEAYLDWYAATLDRRTSQRAGAHAASPVGGPE